MAAIAPFRKLFLERRRQMMRIDDERFHARRDEMIEREGDERLLKNRDKRFRQHLRERPHSEAKASAEDKGSGNHERADLELKL
jgi:hypothetical protein